MPPPITAMLNTAPEAAFLLSVIFRPLAWPITIEGLSLATPLSFTRLIAVWITRGVIQTGREDVKGG